VIVTLAGHVDHGKTSLVRALTGVNTDRLAQEQARGLTIDLGFAYIDDGAIGFVDVPGHHKFIHNMVAGVACHQHALLVVAADDGPMPQTREHLDILSMVGLKSGAIALTKCDQSSDARIAECETEISAIVEGSFLQSAPLFRTTTEAPDSFTPLLEHLREVGKSQQQQHSEQPFRLAIDRVFVIKGAGVVVTGTVHSGTVRLDDSLHHFPSLESVRVRSIHAQDQPQSIAHVGDRCALNVSGLTIETLNRGDWLCGHHPQSFTNISIDLRTLPHFPRSIKHWTPVHVYHATSHSTGRIALLDSHAIAPGSRALVDLALDGLLNCSRGDQLVVRDHSLDLTLGGGEVVYAEERASTRRRSIERKERLGAYGKQDWQTCLDCLLETGSADLGEITKNWLIASDVVNTYLTEKNAHIFGKLAVTADHWDTLSNTALAHIGDADSAIRENDLPAQIGLALRQPILNDLVRQNKILHIGGTYRLPEQKTQVPEALQPLWSQLQTMLAYDQAPSSGDLAKVLNQPQMMLEVRLRELVKLGLLIEIANHRFYLPQQLASIATGLAKLANGSTFTVREFRDQTGIGRNVAIEILEYFDGRGFTRRQGNERILLRAAL